MDPIRVLDPTSKPDHAEVTAPRLPALKGTRIGVLWNNRPRGDRVLQDVASRIESEFGAKTTFARKLRVGSGADDSEVKLFEKEVEAVIVGVGD